MTTPLVRVKDPASGHEYDVPQSRLTVCPGLVVLDKPTGRTKPRLPLGTPLPGGRVDRERERMRSAAQSTPVPSPAPTLTPAPETPAAEKNDGQSVATEKEN